MRHSHVLLEELAFDHLFNHLGLVLWTVSMLHVGSDATHLFEATVPLKQIEYGFGYIIPPYTPYSIYLRGTIILVAVISAPTAALSLIRSSTAP